MIYGIIAQILQLFSKFATFPTEENSDTMQAMNPGISGRKTKGGILR